MFDPLGAEPRQPLEPKECSKPMQGSPRAQGCLSKNLPPKTGILRTRFLGAQARSADVQDCFRGWRRKVQKDFPNLFRMRSANRQGLPGRTRKLPPVK